MRLRSTKPSKRLEKMRSKAYRSSMVEASIENMVAYQVKLLREKNGWSQKELAKKIGTQQSAVARIEDPSYGRLSIATLLKLSKIFDVSLSVHFEPYTSLLRRSASLTPSDITPLSYKEQFHESGDILSTVDVKHDASIICMTHYCSPSYFLQG